MFYQTQATTKIAKLTKRIRAVPGGTSASKTISILLYLIALSQSDKERKLTSVVSESVPHLKRGAIRDFKNILIDHKYWNDNRWNASDSIYTFETGSQIEFFSADQADKLRGGRRDRLFINEANNVTFDAFEQLEVRTRDFCIMDWNPSNEFWYYEEVKPKRTDVEEITLTYKDNEALDINTILSIEQRMNRKGWWTVYGLGQLGEVEGKIYKDWDIIDEVPHVARLERIGLDFGYSNDPTAIVAIYYYQGGYIFDELTFLKGLSNKQIADIILSTETNTMVVADSAEPKSIDEIKSYGVNIIGAEKGKDSVCNGIQLVQDQRCSITKRSINIIKEYRNYLWEVDRDGKVLNVPEHAFSHCFAPETLIHTTKGLKRIDELVGKEGFLYTKDGLIKRFYDVKPTRKNADIVSIEFDDGNTLSVTPDHLLLTPSGIWKEAGLFCSQDMIQSVIYGKTKKHYGKFFSSRLRSIQRKFVFPLSWSKVLQRICEWKEIFSTPLCLGTRGRGNSSELSYSPQGRQPYQQQYQQLRVQTQDRAFKSAYDSSEERNSKEVDRKNKTSCKQMARVRRGDKVSLVAWEEKLGRKKTIYKRMFSLPYEIRNSYQSLKRQILSSELQNESETKKIKRITRGRRAITYNLEVEDTHCLLANGVIAHNSMDALRYGMSNIIKQPKFEMPKQSAPALPYYGDTDLNF